jgi:hypothetical protein
MAQQPPDGGRFGFLADRQRTLVIAAAGVVVLLLFFFLILPNLFGGGGGGGGGTTAQPPLARPRQTTTTLPRAGAPSESFEVFNTKNPFTPLMSPATPGGGGTTGTTPASGTGGATGATTGGGTAASGGTPTGGGTTATTAAGSGASGGAATEPRRSQRVALLNVYTKSGKTVADVRVNDTVYTGIAPGQTFASNFQLVSLQGQCGTFLFGDERFQLCKGEEVLK